MSGLGQLQTDRSTANLDGVPNFDIDLDEGEQNSEPEVQTERRTHGRIKPELKGFRGFSRKWIDAISKWVSASWVGWLSLVLVIAAGLTLLWWSLEYRVRHLDDNFALVDQLSAHRNEFAELLTKLSHEDIRNLRERVSNAETSIFPGYEALAGWLNKQAGLARQFKLDMRYTMSEPNTSKINQVVELPIEIQLSSPIANKTQSYLHMLEFIKTMVDDQWRLEISSASMRSQGQGASNFIAAIRVWVRDPDFKEQQGVRTDEAPTE